MIVWDDLNTIISPDTNTTVWDAIITLESDIPTGGDLRVRGTQIDADACAGHHLDVGVCGWGTETREGDRRWSLDLEIWR